jgi:hypothetical protein
MIEPLHVSDIRFTAAGPEDITRGLVGWTSFVLNEQLRVDGVTIRKTATGRICLSFPARTTPQGRRRFFIHPMSDSARLDIERQILGVLGFLEEAPR